MYENPIKRAANWKNELESGHYKSVAEMARAESIDRCHIYRHLRLLVRLHPDAVKAIEALGDFYEGRLITEADLRQIINLLERQHIKAVLTVIKEREASLLAHCETPERPQ